MARWSQHHHVSTDARLHTCTEVFEPRHLGLDIVGLDVQMDRSVFGRHALETDEGSAFAAETSLERYLSGVVLLRNRLAAQCLTPE